MLANFGGYSSMSWVGTTRIALTLLLRWTVKPTRCSKLLDIGGSVFGSARYCPTRNLSGKSTSWSDEITSNDWLSSPARIVRTGGGRAEHKPAASTQSC